MGWTPAQVDACGLWEFSAALDGYARAHGGGEKTAAGGGTLSDEQLRAMGIDGF